MKTVEGREVPPKYLATLDPSEVPRFAAFPAFTTVVAGHHWDAALLLLTDRRMLIVRTGMLGKPKVAHQSAWDRVNAIAAGLWNGGGPQIQLLITTDTTSYAPIELIVEPEYADAIEAAVRAGYRSARPSPPTDPNELVRWMQAEFDQGDYRDIWEHRLVLGLGFTQAAMSSETWFWINAYSALAALRAEIRLVNPMGQPDWHPLVATCAGYADEVHRNLGASAQAANAEIAQRFFAE